MFKLNKLILTASVLTLGMMSSAITLANTADAQNNTQAGEQNQQPQQKAGSFTDTSAANQEEKEKETQGLNLGGPDANYSVDTNTGAEIVKGITETNSTVQIQSGPTSTVVTTTNSSNKEADTYPSFSSEEIVSLNMQEESAEEVPAEGEQPEETELEYREEVAVLYQHLPEDPIYTYGVDGSGKGQCTGTECEEFAAIWDEFEARQADGKSLIILEEGDARQGKIAMPQSFAVNVKNQPAIEPNKAQDCPTGYTYADSNEYQNSAHCGKMDGNTYYVTDPQ